MALKPCRECKSLVSNVAKTCPNCGVSKPVKKSGRWAWILLSLIILFIVVSPKNENQRQKSIENAETTIETIKEPQGNSRQPREDINKNFANCLAEKAKIGSYTSNDGGKSAIILMGACEDEWHAWSDRCIADGVVDGECTMKAAMLAQAALKLSGK